MKRKIIMLVNMAAMIALLLTGCSNSDSQPGAGNQEVEDTSETAETVEAETASEDEENVEEAEEEPAAASITPEDGVYTAEFHTDSSMFHISEACDGKGILTVENGEMTIHVSLASKNIVNLFPGVAEDARKDGAELLEPTTDSVTYSDGITEDVYGFDIPVPAIDQEFDLALIGTKGNWYDHKISVTNPEKME